MSNSFIISVGWELKLRSKTGNILETNVVVQIVVGWGRKLEWFSRI